MSTPTSGEWLKDPDAVLPWVFDWSSWLDSGETLLTSIFIVSAGITVNSNTNTTTSATVWLSGGTSGKPYLVTNRVTTSLGKTDDRSITIRVQQR